MPADNNYSERVPRPLVISRKLSFSTQSSAGSRTRTVLTSVPHSLEKRGFDPVFRLREAISLKAATPDTDLADFLFPIVGGELQLRSPPVQSAYDDIAKVSMELVRPPRQGPDRTARDRKHSHRAP